MEGLIAVNSEMAKETTTGNLVEDNMLSQDVVKKQEVKKSSNPGTAPTDTDNEPDSSINSNCTLSINGNEVDGGSNSSKQENITTTPNNKIAIDVAEVSEGSNILIKLAHISSNGFMDMMEVDEIREEDAVLSNCNNHSLDGGLCTPNQDHLKTPAVSTIKKSNLRKVSKYESLSQSLNYSFHSFNSPSTMTTPRRPADDSNPTPRKRIRIVEDIDLQKELIGDDEGGGESSSGEADLVDQVDLISGYTFQTSYAGEEMVWVSPPPATLDFTLIHEGIVRASRLPVTKKFSVEIDMHFIDGETINSLLECKPLIVTAGFFNFEQACRTNCPPTRSNNYIYSENASNLKSLDDGLNSDLVFPKDLLQKDDCEKNVFYFADIWVSSKGFREYILSKSLEYLREGVMTKGFVIQDADGTRPKDYNSACGLLFSSFHVPIYSKDQELAGSQLPVELLDHFVPEDGKSSDICEISISDEFIKNILAKTNDKGVHLLVADNPEYLNVPEFVREVRFQRKFYAQCIIALLAVREGGSFVVKIFDAITLFTAGLIFLMHRCFRSISIHKPQTSSSHTSERFLVCTGKLACESSEDILQFLLICHNIVMKHEEIRKIVRKKTRRRLGTHLFEVKQLVPLKVIIGHADFFEFLRLQNIRFTKSLISKLHDLCSSIPISCSWKLQGQPHKVEQPLALENKTGVVGLDLKSTQDECRSLLKKFGLSSDFLAIEEMNDTRLQEISQSRDQWTVFSVQDCKSVIGAHPVTLFIGLGEDSVVYFNGSEFVPICVDGLSLTKGTILFGNIVELIPRKDTNSTQDNNASVQLEFHIFDGISLSGQFIGDFPYAKRKQLCAAYSGVMNKCKSYQKCTVIKVREPLVLKSNDAVLSLWINSCVYTQQNVCHYPGFLRLTNFPQPDSPSSISVGGLLFYKTCGNIKDSLGNRVAWNWNDDDKIKGPQSFVSVKDIIAIKM